jgi:hypothetical protein
MSLTRRMIGFSLLLGAVFGSPAGAAVPSTALSYYVPQAGSIETPIVGAAALRSFRLCPNNDGSQSLPRSARIKVVIKNGNGSGISGIASSDIIALFNGGTREQGFDNIGADSIIANSRWNPGCPDLATGVPGLLADGPTDQNGVTYVTFTGAVQGIPGIGVRNPNRKWGHYDSAIPVYVFGLPLQGRLTETSPQGSYVLQIKNLDSEGGLDPVLDQGERVTMQDIAPVQSDVKHARYDFWHDFDWDGVVSSADLNLVQAHRNHSCTKPLNP